MNITFSSLGDYKAKVLEFSSGACKLSNNYYLPPNSLNFISTFREVGLRTLSLTVEYMTSSEMELVQNSSNLTALLASSEGVILEPGDGFNYQALLSQYTELSLKSPTIQTQTFTFLGYRRGINPITLIGNTSLIIQGNFRAYPRFTFDVSSIGAKFGDITFNITGTVVIDSINKLVTRGGFNVMDQVRLFEFPYVEPGTNTFTYSGLTFVLEYYPIYF